MDSHFVLSYVLSQVSHLYNKCTGAMPLPNYTFSDKDITH